MTNEDFDTYFGRHDLDRFDRAIVMDVLQDEGLEGALRKADDLVLAKARRFAMLKDVTKRFFGVDE